MHLPLPPAEMRWGGPRYRDDEVYITSGEAEYVAEGNTPNHDDKVAFFFRAFDA